MDSNFVQWLIGQAGIGGLAAFALWMLNDARKQQIADAKAVRDQYREDSKQLVEVVKENTAVLRLVASHLHDEDDKPSTRR